MQAALSGHGHHINSHSRVLEETHRRQPKIITLALLQQAMAHGSARNTQSWVDARLKNNTVDDSASLIMHSEL